MFDNLWDESPMTQKIEEESQAEGFTRGKLYEARRVLVNIVKLRFPSLADLARQKVAEMSKVGAIELLIEQVVRADDESLACWLLSPTIALSILKDAKEEDIW